MGDRLGQHGFAATGRAEHEHTARRVDADLLVELEVGERQLHGLANFLLLDVHASDVGVLDVRLLIGAQHGDGGIGFRWQHVDQRVGVLVQRHRRRRLEQLSIQSGQNADVVIGAGSGTHDTRVLVHGFQKLADDQRDALNPLDFLLRVEIFFLQVLLLVLDIILLDLQELQLLLQTLVFRVEIVAFGNVHDGGERRLRA